MKPDSNQASRAVSFSCAKSILDYNISARLGNFAGIRQSTSLPNRLDPHRPFQEAVNIAKQEELSRLWAADVSAAISSLERMGIQELKSLAVDDIELKAI